MATIFAATHQINVTMVITVWRQTCWIPSACPVIIPFSKYWATKPRIRCCRRRKRGCRIRTAWCQVSPTKQYVVVECRQNLQSSKPPNNLFRNMHRKTANVPADFSKFNTKKGNGSQCSRYSSAYKRCQPHLKQRWNEALTFTKRRYDSISRAQVCRIAILVLFFTLRSSDSRNDTGSLCCWSLDICEVWLLRPTASYLFSWAFARCIIVATCVSL